MFRSPLTLDRANRISTAIVCILLAGGIVAMLASDHPATRGPAWILAATFALCWAMSPRALVVEGGEIRIERRLWPALRVARADVERASPLNSLGRRVMRVGGVGGLFGSFGFFRSTDLGWFRLYATRRGQAVYIARRGAMPLVVTPDDVAGTIDAIDTRPRIVAYEAPKPPPVS